MRRAVIFALILVATGIFQAWFLGLKPRSLASGHSSGSLADRYTEALAMGQSNLPLPAQERGKYQIFDASYYGNRVYLCFGITPFAVLIVPWFKATGTFLSEAACILVFTQLGYLAYGCALWLCFRRDRRLAMDWLIAAGFLATVVGSGTWTLLGRPAVYEIEAAAAYASFAAAIAFYAAALGSRQRPTLFLSAAALFAALTMGCRPAYCPAVALIAVAIGCHAWAGAESVPSKARRLLLCWAPIAVVGVALAVWNYERFSSIFEFGYGYTAFAQRRPELIRFSPGNLPYNLHRYLLGGFRLGHYFPFFDGIREGPFPLPKRTHEGVDQVYGSLLLFPILGYALIPFFKKHALGGFLLAAAAANLLVLSGMGVGTFRYPPDYLGILSFAAGVGICCLPQLAGRIGRRVAIGLLAPALGWSVFCGICETAAVSRTNSFDVNRPRDFATLGTPFNRMAFWLESLARSGPRKIRLRLLLPGDKYGRVEPIAVVGDAGRQDFVYFYYTGPRAIQVGFESMGNGGPVSAPMEIDYGREHVVDISLGSFLPPDGHPLLRSLSGGDISIARDFIRIEIDHKAVLEGPARLHPARGRILVGESPDDPAFGERFTGMLLGVERPLLSPADVGPGWLRNQFGPVVLAMKLRPMQQGTRQPLVSLGYRPSGGVLFIENRAPGEVRLGWQRYGRDPLYSAPIAWSPQQSHKLEFEAGSLLPPDASSLWPPGLSQEKRQEEKRVLRCRLDGREVWRLEEATPDVAPSSVVIGRNGLLQAGVADSLATDRLSVNRGAW